ncbi:Crp/Fnr family transcriptional regulator [Limnohabitans sp. T6-5]|uniref:Crp/Fnr family transcriptional regulator n=1 Tax=Limnohabitans sp. T6-5 TaxID=1100724 RepID=UPI000D3CD701|nr:Crp/Fnr family transcriptional regulator [Limnohabitans sp. T6-5]PUE11610.1 Crp/Fnr family transcriptional regulator [Limnohabitans sp. T6-5]
MTARRNTLLELLPESVYANWKFEFEYVDLPMGKVLCEPGSIVSHIYFPTSAIISWVHVLENGASTEIAMIGREGLVGFYLLSGAAHSPNRAVVQIAGQAIRIRLSSVLASLQEEGMSLQKIFLRFNQVLITQMAQMAVCNRHHTLDQQLCRLLLLTLDRQDGNTINLTHEMIANMLGVRREGVTNAASRLMKEGGINYSRGRITVLDTCELQKRSCECYTVVKKAYDRLKEVPNKLMKY